VCLAKLKETPLGRGGVGGRRQALSIARGGRKRNETRPQIGLFSLSLLGVGGGNVSWANTNAAAADDETGWSESESSLHLSRPQLASVASAFFDVLERRQLASSHLKLGFVAKKKMKESFFFPPTQDGAPIDDVTWTRYRKSSKSGSLKVRNANRDDTGVYSCKAVNGFGSAEARVELIVVGEKKSSSSWTSSSSSISIFSSLEGISRGSINLCPFPFFLPFPPIATHGKRSESDSPKIFSRSSKDHLEVDFSRPRRGQGEGEQVPPRHLCIRNEVN